MKENAKIHKNRYMVKIILLRRHFCLRKMLSKHPLLVKKKNATPFLNRVAFFWRKGGDSNP